MHEIAPARKKDQLIQSARSSDTVNFRVQRPDWRYTFLNMLNQNIFYQLLIFLNLYQHAKNVSVSSFCSQEIVNLKILQSDWLRAF